MVVQGFLQSRFPQPFLRLTAREHRSFVLGMAGLGVAGGSAYDALVAATVVACGAQLITCDKRALPVYERYGVKSQMIA